MNEKAEKIIAKSAYTVSEELKKINAFMCAENYLTGYKTDETDIDKMLKEICPMEYGDSDGGIEKNKGLEYIKEIPHNSKIKIIFENN